MSFYFLLERLSTKITALYDLVIFSTCNENLNINVLYKSDQEYFYNKVRNVLYF